MRLKFFIMAVIVAIGTFGVFTSNASAQAQDGITPWMTLWTWAGYEYRDKNWVGGSNPGGLEAANSKSDSDIFMGLGSSDTQFGLKFQKGPIFAQASAAIGPDADTRKDTNFYARPIFVELSMTKDLKLLAGYGGSPYTNADNNDVTSAEKNKKAGGMDDAVNHQVKFSFFDGYFMIMRPMIENSTTANTLSSTQTDSVIPKLAAGYALKFGDFSLMINGVYQTYKIDSPADSTVAAQTPYKAIDGKSITAYAGNAIFKGQLGAFNFYVHGFYSQNLGDMGIGSLSGKYTMAQIVGTGAAMKIEDTKVYGGNAGFSLKMNPITLAGGVGGDVADNDSFLKKDQNISGYVSLAYNFTPEFQIVPEVKVVDKLKNKDDKKEGRQYRAGFAFKANL
jgi:hypothetical protein